MMIRFGSAGNPKDFYDRKFSKSEQMPGYLHGMGLNAYEYQCSRGVRINEEKALELKAESEKYSIALSVHAPYYISLSTPDEEKQQNSVNYILASARAAALMGADRIVIHSGALLKQTRQQALDNSKRLLVRAMAELDREGLSQISLCPETMGKLNQIGDSDEVIQLCRLDERFLPAIDFGHLYCRRLGGLVTEKDWEEELLRYLDVLGYERMRHFHSHFSKMEYTSGGEKCHVTFAREDCGPYFEAVAAVLKKLALEPRIICESAGTQSLDAAAMREIYLQQ